MGLRGVKCETMNDFWGGPFFDDNGESSLRGISCRPALPQTTRELTAVFTGKVLREDFLGGEGLAGTVTALAGDEKDDFLDLASRMLAWFG